MHRGVDGEDARRDLDADGGTEGGWTFWREASCADAPRDRATGPPRPVHTDPGIGSRSTHEEAAA